jgi:hypothetical protein
VSAAIAQRLAERPDGAALTPKCAKERKQAMSQAKQPGTWTCVDSKPAGTSKVTPRKRAGGASTNGVVPSTCGDGFWAYTRATACLSGVDTVYVFTVPQGVLVGLMDVEVTTFVNTFVPGGVYSQEAQFFVLFAVGTEGTFIQGTGSCTGGCTTQSVSFPAQPLAVIDQRASAVVTGRSLLTPGGRGFGRGPTSLTSYYTNSRWTPPYTNSLTLSPGDIRCDTFVTTQIGCVFEQVMPIYNVYSFSYPSYARHIALAIGYGLPSVLTRLESSELRELNGRTACPEFLFRPDGFSCDEYPFRSTYQGAFTSSAPYGRTFDGCQITAVPIRQFGDTNGFSICMIPRSENSGGGGSLSVFYSTDRVLDGERFQVVVN